MTANECSKKRISIIVPCSSQFSLHFGHLGTNYVCGQIPVPILAPNGCYCFYGSVAKHNDDKFESLRFDSSLENLMFPLPHCS